MLIIFAENFAKNVESIFAKPEEQKKKNSSNTFNIT